MRASICLAVAPLLAFALSDAHAGGPTPRAGELQLAQSLPDSLTKGKTAEEVKDPNNVPKKKKKNGKPDAKDAATEGPDKKVDKGDVKKPDRDAGKTGDRGKVNRKADKKADKPTEKKVDKKPDKPVEKKADKKPDAKPDKKAVDVKRDDRGPAFRRDRGDDKIKIRETDKRTVDKTPGKKPISVYKRTSKTVVKKPITADEKARHAKLERERFEKLKKERRTVTEEGGRRVIIEEPDKRRIIREKNRVTIRHDEDDRFRRLNVDTRRRRDRDGNDVTIVFAPGGVRIFSESDRHGRPMRRWRRYPDGRETVFYDNRSYYRRFGDREPSFVDAVVDLPPPRLTIPRERYAVEYEGASDDDIYETLTAPPVEDLDRTYSLEEVRQSRYVRDRMRRLDLDTITFDFGSWEVLPDDYPRLERVARIMSRILDANPDEMFLIEGHTDAVGDDEDNLTLSDRRAESVAIVLSEEFGVPPENLTTQGYGEQILKIETDGPERLNRRVAVRRITPLLAR